jgi:hypothetical protein
MAAGLIHLAWDLIVKLPLTRAALRDGIIDIDKARVIAMQCLLLTPEEARRAERILFGLGIEEMTGGMIRDRIGCAVIAVNPGAARKRREEAERNGRVEVFPELSGNTHISGRELPPALALLADQNIDARARQFKAAGVPGDMDRLRTLAYLEMLGAGTPHPATPATAADNPGTAADNPANDADDPGGNGPRGDDPGNGGDDPGNDGNGPSRNDGDGPGGSGDGGNGWDGPSGPQPGTPDSGTVPPGFAAKVNLTISLADLTIPLLTFLGLADRPAMMSRTGPVDPDLARTLAAAAARNPDSTWCITVTGTDHRPVAHGCGRPPPPGRKRGRGKRGAARQGRTGAHDPPGTGTMRLDIAALTGNTTSTGGTGELEFTLENLAGPCDHKYQTAGHDPGVKLRHLTGILNQYCTYLTCRRPHRTCDYEHSKPFDKGGRTCLCEGGPVCRHHHRDKQAPGWQLEHGEARGWFRWTTASGRTYTTKPTQYPD